MTGWSAKMLALLVAGCAAPAYATVFTLQVDAVVTGIVENGVPTTSPFFAIGSAAAFSLTFDTAQAIGIGGRPGVASLALPGAAGSIAIGGYRKSFQAGAVFGQGSTTASLLLEDDFNGADEQDFAIGDADFAGTPPFALAPGETPVGEAITLEQRDPTQTAIDGLDLSDLQTDPNLFANRLFYAFGTQSPNDPIGTGYAVSFSRPTIRLASGVPEPAAWGTMLAGFGMIGAVLRARGRRHRRSSAAEWDR